MSIVIRQIECGEKTELLTLLPWAYAGLDIGLGLGLGLGLSLQ